MGELVAVVLVALISLACGNPLTSTPTPCTTCSGTGRVTHAVEARLAGRVDCDQQARSTGFLGLGEEHVVVQAKIYNDSPAGGIFTVAVKAGIPGQAQAVAVPLATGEDFVGPGTSVIHSFDFPRSQLTNLSVICSVTPPTSVQQVTELCPTCNGRGLVP